MHKRFDCPFKVPNQHQQSTLGIEIQQNWPFVSETGDRVV
jgi:hypothetical protein